ncbi:uncharacterized protein FIBRA_05544 [Fibroporia radiculosa]|uniref:Uncharacterized protein n=1 Tax=Fibroporia radiculosa TaxID=599839 RepID=J4G9P6_9APHY|nr:uncharacterized protein FIBRA_05544 [Fibroporia radiculosa]CCM03413.1 predicted protein [Fibroporia radiculosa]
MTYPNAVSFTYVSLHSGLHLCKIYPPICVAHSDIESLHRTSSDDDDERTAQLHFVPQSADHSFDVEQRVDGILKSDMSIDNAQCNEKTTKSHLRESDAYSRSGEHNQMESLQQNAATTWAPRRIVLPADASTCIRPDIETATDEVQLSCLDSARLVTGASAAAKSSVKYILPLSLTEAIESSPTADSAPGDTNIEQISEVEQIHDDHLVDFEVYVKDSLSVLEVTDDPGSPCTIFNGSPLIASLCSPPNTAYREENYVDPLRIFVPDVEQVRLPVSAASTSALCCTDLVLPCSISGGSPDHAAGSLSMLCTNAESCDLLAGPSNADVHPIADSLDAQIIYDPDTTAEDAQRTSLLLDPFCHVSSSSDSPDGSRVDPKRISSDLSLTDGCLGHLDCPIVTDGTTLDADPVPLSAKMFVVDTTTGLQVAAEKYVDDEKLTSSIPPQLPYLVDLVVLQLPNKVEPISTECSSCDSFTEATSTSMIADTASTYFTDQEAPTAVQAPRVDVNISSSVPSAPNEEARLDLVVLPLSPIESAQLTGVLDLEDSGLSCSLGDDLCSDMVLDEKSTCSQYVDQDAEQLLTTDDIPSSPLPSSSPFPSSSPCKIFSSSPPCKGSSPPSSPPLFAIDHHKSHLEGYQLDFDARPIVGAKRPRSLFEPALGIPDEINGNEGSHHTSSFANQSPKKYMKMDGSLRPNNLSNPKRPTLISQQKQRRKLVAPFRSPLVDIAFAHHGVDAVYASGRIPRGLEAAKGETVDVEALTRPNLSYAVETSDATVQTKDCTRNAAKQFKSPLSVGSSVPNVSFSSVTAMPTIQALQRRLQMLKQAIRIKTAGAGLEEAQLEELVEKWVTVGREVAWAVWDTVKDQNPGESINTWRGKSGWLEEEFGRGEGSRSGGATGAYQVRNEGIQDDEENISTHTPGTMLRHLGIAPETLGWDEQEGDFVDLGDI